MVFSIHTFELTLDNKEAYNKWHPIVKHRLKVGKVDGIPIDYTFNDDGMSVKYDDRHKKRIKLIVNPSVILGGDDLDLWKPNGSNRTKLCEILDILIDSCFKGDYEIDNFRLTRVDFTVNIYLGDPNAVSAYIKVLHNIGKVKGFSPKYGKHDYAMGNIDKKHSFDLVGNSNGVEFTAYDKQAQLQKHDQPKSRIEKAEGLLRIEVRLTGHKLVYTSTGEEVSTSKQIRELSKRSEEIFMIFFRLIVPLGDYYTKSKADKIIKDNVSEKTLRKKMLWLLELIPEKKSLLLAQKELDDRNIKGIMKRFEELNVSPVTLSKRHDVKELDSLYTFLT